MTCLCSLIISTQPIINSCGFYIVYQFTFLLLYLNPLAETAGYVAFLLLPIITTFSSFSDLTNTYFRQSHEQFQMD